jgi:hypothetical protein
VPGIPAFFAGVALGAAGVFLMAYALWPLSARPPPSPDHPARQALSVDLTWLPFSELPHQW